MGKKYQEPTSIRDRQCALCGCFFTSQGLSGHMRYAHKDMNGNEGFKQLAELEERKRCAVAYAQGLGLLILALTTSHKDRFHAIIRGDRSGGKHERECRFQKSWAGGTGDDSRANGGSGESRDGKVQGG